MRTSAAGKTLAALAVASLIGGLAAGTALAQDNGRHEGNYKHEVREERRDHVRDWRGRDGWRDNRGWHEYRVVQAPPPVVYAPSQSPGISIFFPFFR